MSRCVIINTDGRLEVKNALNGGDRISNVQLRNWISEQREVIPAIFGLVLVTVNAEYWDCLTPNEFASDLQEYPSRIIGGRAVLCAQDRDRFVGLPDEIVSYMEDIAKNIPKHGERRSESRFRR